MATKENETLQLISMRNQMVKAHYENLKLDAHTFTISKEISDFIIEKLPSLKPEMLKLLRRINRLKEARRFFENSAIEQKVSKYTSYYLCLNYLEDSNIKLNSSQIPELKENRNLPHLKELEKSENALRYILDTDIGDNIELRVPYCIKKADKDGKKVKALILGLLSDRKKVIETKLPPEIFQIYNQLEIFSNIAQDEAWGVDALQKEVKGFYRKVILQFDSTFPNILEESNWTMRLGVLLLVIVLALLLMIPLSQTSTFKEYFSEETTETLNPFVAPTCGEVFRYMRELGVKDEISCKCTLKHNLKFECCLQPTNKTIKVSFSELIPDLISFNTVFWIATSISMYLTVKDLLKAWVY